MEGKQCDTVLFIQGEVNVEKEVERERKLSTPVKIIIALCVGLIVATITASIVMKSNGIQSEVQKNDKDVQSKIFNLNNFNPNFSPLAQKRCLITDAEFKGYVKSFISSKIEFLPLLMKQKCFYSNVLSKGNKCDSKTLITLKDSASFQSQMRDKNKRNAEILQIVKSVFEELSETLKDIKNDNLKEIKESLTTMIQSTANLPCVETTSSVESFVTSYSDVAVAGRSHEERTMAILDQLMLIIMVVEDVLFDRQRC